MKEEELLHLLAIQKAKGIGDIYAKKLIETCGSPIAIFKEKSNILQSINGLGALKLKSLFDKQNMLAAEKELTLLQSQKIKPLYYLNSDYPEKLKNCADGPILLFQDGRFDLNQKKIISIVGTRKATTYGMAICEKIIEGLTVFNPVIVSGFAYGIDICAHKSAVSNKLQTVGVLAHGFGNLYPKAHKKYMNSIYENGGFMSEFWYDENPIRENFLKRNRIVAGISEATIVIESAERGGALVTADIANSYSRDVFAVPGRCTDTYSKGCNYLIRDNKAALINSADDIVNYLRWEKTTSEKAVQPQLFIDVSKEEEMILSVLPFEQTQSIDLLALQAKIPVYKVASLLFHLEMKGLVKALPGKKYQRIG